MALWQEAIKESKCGLVYRFDKYNNTVVFDGHKAIKYLKNNPDMTHYERVCGDRKKRRIT